MNHENQQKIYGWSSATPQFTQEYIWPPIKSLLPPGHLKILDMGCGNGFLANKLFELGHEVVGVDVSEDGIQLAKATYPSIRYEVKSVYDSFDDFKERFDLVLSSEVIEHLYFPGKLLNNANVVLKQKGYLIITTPYHGYWKNLLISLCDKWDDHFTALQNGMHIKFFSENTLSKIIRDNGFNQITFKNSGRFPLLWKAMICRAIKIGQISE